MESWREELYASDRSKFLMHGGRGSGRKPIDQGGAKNGEAKNTIPGTSIRTEEGKDHRAELENIRGNGLGREDPKNNGARELTDKEKKKYYKESDGSIHKIPSGGKLLKEREAEKLKWFDTKEGKDYKKLMTQKSKELNDLADKYGLDRGNGSGGNRNLYGKDEIRLAKNQWNQKANEIVMDSFGAGTKQGNYATNAIIKKYGDTALTKMEHAGEGAAIATGAAFMAAALAGGYLVYKISG